MTKNMADEFKIGLEQNHKDLEFFLLKLCHLATTKLQKKENQKINNWVISEAGLELRQLFPKTKSINREEYQAVLKKIASYENPYRLSLIDHLMIDRGLEYGILFQEILAYHMPNINYKKFVELENRDVLLHFISFQLKLIQETLEQEDINENIMRAISYSYNSYMIRGEEKFARTFNLFSDRKIRKFARECSMFVVDDRILSVWSQHHKKSYNHHKELFACLFLNNQPITQVYLNMRRMNQKTNFFLDKGLSEDDIVWFKNILNNLDESFIYFLKDYLLYFFSMIDHVNVEKQVLMDEYYEKHYKFIDNLAHKIYARMFFILDKNELLNEEEIIKLNILKKAKK